MVVMAHFGAAKSAEIFLSPNSCKRRPANKHLRD
jgi:hypothetical protein